MSPIHTGECMLCIYFEIPYESQLFRIAPFEIQKILDTIGELAEENGASVYKIGVGYVYCFHSNEAGAAFSTYLFLHRLAYVLHTEEDRLFDYRVIIDCCEQADSEKTVTDHFSAYKKLLLPRSSFFASAQAEPLLQAYIQFSYIPQYSLYRCEHFVVPHYVKKDLNHEPYRIYLRSGDTWVHALYHFMLLYPLNDTAIVQTLSKAEKAEYERAQHVLYYIRKRRFCSEYPDYVTDTFLTYTHLYFRVFTAQHRSAELILAYPENCAQDAQMLLQTFPSLHTEVLSDMTVNLKGIAVDFLLIAYFAVYASYFIFEDEMQEFFLSLHKKPAFAAKLYEWMYASGITDEKNNTYSVHQNMFTALEKQLGVQKDRVKPYITAFLQDKYENGMLCPDDDLNKIFFGLHAHLHDDCMLHYVFHKYSDKDLLQLNISPFRQLVFFDSLVRYQKALILNNQNETREAAYAVRQAISAMQALKFPAGEYRSLSCIARLHLSENKIEDALTYFQYALDSAETLGDSSFICEVLYNLSVSCFLQNNLQAAADYLERLLHAVTIYFEKSEEVLCLFMQGRVALQLGDYGKAKDLFKQAENAAAPYFREWLPLCRIWYARALSHQGQHVEAESLFIAELEDSPDASAFLLESYVLSPVVSQERLSAARLRNAFTKMQEPYHSGFLLAEEFVFGHLYRRPALQVFYDILESYYQLRLALQKQEKTAQSYLKKLEDTVHEALKNRDIYASLYLYLCYDALIGCKCTGSDAAHTYLSRSFQILKNSMDTMSETAYRDAFIFGNVWNAKLYAAAQKNTLI